MNFCNFIQHLFPADVFQILPQTQMLNRSLVAICQDAASDNKVILTMSFLRKHWYDLGALFSMVVVIGVSINYSYLTNYQLLMWLSLVTLFLHQLEEYRIVGTFPGMMNTVMYRSTMPDRHPLNTNTAFYVNVVVGWTCYLLAAVFSEKTVWLGMATILVSVGNTIAHTVIFNRRGKTIYNAGMATSLLLFVPCAYFFFSIIRKEHLVTTLDYILGTSLGIFLNAVGIVKLIDWMADKNTGYIFEERNLLKQNKNSR